MSQREVEVGIVKVVQANVRKGKPLILEGPVKAFQPGVVFRLANAGKDMLDTKQATGSFELTGEFGAIVGMEVWQVTFREEEQAFKEVSGLAGGAASIDAGEGQPSPMFEGGKDITGLTVPAELDGIDMPQEQLGEVLGLMNVRFRRLLVPFGDPFGVRVELEQGITRSIFQVEIGSW